MIKPMIMPAIKKLPLLVLNSLLLFLLGCGERDLSFFQKTDLLVENMSASEGDEFITIEYSLKLAREEDTVLIYSTIDGTAKKTTSQEEGDYTAVKEQTVVIPAGQLEPSEPIIISINNDRLDENQEYFKVVFKSQSSSFSTEKSNLDKEVVVVIGDNDSPPHINLEGVVANEDEGQVMIHYTLTSVSGKESGFSWRTVNGTAQHSRGDYIPQSKQRVTIPPGTSRGSFSVSLQDDLIDEYDEEFEIVIAKKSLLNITREGSDLRASIQILDNDNPPQISLRDLQVSEGEGRARLFYQLSEPSEKEIRFVWDTFDLTATSVGDHNDYIAMLDQEVVIPQGTQAGYVDITIIDDSIYEKEKEEFSVRIQTSSLINLNTSVNPEEATISIIENDLPPIITLSGASANEAEGQVLLTYSLNTPSDQESRFSWKTVDGTAVSGKDYQENSGIIVIPKGATRGTLLIPLVDDLVDEYDESFSLVIDENELVGISSQGSVLRKSITIVDNDLPPTIQLSNLVVGEGDDQASLQYTLSSPTEKRTSFRWSTFDDSAKSSERDYESYTNKKTIVFVDNSLTGRFSIPIYEDTIDENNESFVVRIDQSSLNEAVIRTSGSLLEARVTINDNDLPPTIAISDVTVTEDEPSVRINYQLSSPSGKTISAAWYTEDDTATSDANGDFVAVSNESLTILPGVQKGVLLVNLRDDLFYEGNERFSVTLLNSELPLASRAQSYVHIVDNDPPPLFSLGNSSLFESDGQVFVLYRLNSVSIKDCVFDWKTQDLSALSGSDKDYIATSGSVTIPAGSTTGQLSISVNSDNLYEGRNEKFKIIATLSPGSLCIGQNGERTVSSRVTIKDSDSVPAIALQDIVVNEEDGTASIPYTLSHPSALRSSFEWKTNDGTALRGEDYQQQALRRVNIPPEQTQGALIVNLIDDDIPEQSENFNVFIQAESLENLSDTPAFSDLAAVVTISRNDYSITESFSYSEVDPTVDILWVIDDSPSMSVHQDSLANNFADFIANFNAISDTEARLDFNMGIITTTHYVEDQVNKDFPLNLASLQNDRDDFIAEFRNRVRVGDRGDSIERGFLATTTFLSNHPSWIRDDAYLIIIYLSDENEYSFLSSETHATDRNHPDSIQPWVDRILSYKSDSKGLVKIHSIVRTDDRQVRKIGKRYIYASNATGGSVGNIKTRFSDILSNIGSKILEISQSYALSKEVTISTIIVRVDGIALPSKHWEYDEESRSIRFKPGHTPAEGSHIAIEYEVSEV